MQRTVLPAPTAWRRSAGRPRRSTATTSAPAVLDGEVAPRARLSGDGERQPRARREPAEPLDELELDDVVLDRVGEPVAQPVPDAEQLVEPCDPRPALVGRRAREVRDVDRRAAGRELAQALEARGGEELRAGRQVEPRRRREPVALARRRATGRSASRAATYDWNSPSRRSSRYAWVGEGKLPLVVLGHDERHVALDRLEALVPEPLEQRGRTPPSPGAAASAGPRGR